jgi:hypothetical protein
LAREDNLGSSPKVHCTINDALSLAHRIYQKAMTEYPALFSDAPNNRRT